MKPLFIFSLPKSGSTLLQRILGASPHISTATEPWVLLPYIYTLKPSGAISEYWHSHIFDAIEDFYQGFPNGRGDYENELRRFILNLYKKHSHADSLYFLDKTPRYSLICDEIINLFPDGKFIFLWRNPLAVVSSILHRWSKDKWKIANYYIDLYEGIDNMLNAFTTNSSRAHAVRYEKLVQNPAVEVRKLCDYLELEYSDQMIQTFYNTPLVGRMTEHTGSKLYKNTLKKDSLDTWKGTFKNPYRQYWAKKYLKWIGRKRLETMGYDYDELKGGLSKDKKFSMKHFLSDLIYTLCIKYRILLSPLKVHQKRHIKYLFR